MAAMPTAIVTGASRVSASPSPTPWPTAAGGSSSTPATAPRWSPPSPRSATAPMSRRSPAMSATPGTAAASRRRRPRIDLLVSNALDLGPSPLPTLGMLPLDALEQAPRTNLVAPLGLVRPPCPSSSRAGGSSTSPPRRRQPYEGWGGYGASKAALDQLSAILAAENPGLRVYAVDPGDMNTRMHQDAFPGEDISDRPPRRVGARAARADRGRPAERPLRRAGPGRGRPRERGARLPAAGRARGDAPPEARGLPRDEVRLMVARARRPLRRSSSGARGAARAGDLLVVNQSAMIPAALEGVREDGDRVRLHLSTATPRVTAGWSSCAVTASACSTRAPGRSSRCAAGQRRRSRRAAAGIRLWAAELALGGRPWPTTSRARGAEPYAHHPVERPLGDYQTIFARVPGAPRCRARAARSRRAGRARARGVGVARLVLHTGVPREAGDRPTPSNSPDRRRPRRRSTPAPCRAPGDRGRTTVTALESAATPDGVVHPAAGWTDLVIARSAASARSTGC